MPKRMIDSEVTTSRSLNRVSAGAERTFFRLVTLCDDRGRYHGRTDILKSHLYPIDIATTDEVKSWLAELESQGCIHFYSLEGEPYVHLPNWERYQRLRNYKPKHPDPKGNCEKCNGTPLPAAKSGHPRPGTEEKRTELEENSGTSPKSDARDPDFSKTPQKPLDPEHARICHKLIEVIPLSVPGQAVPYGLADPKFRKWVDQIRLLLTIDNKENAGGAWTVDLVLEFLEWVPTHHTPKFSWGPQILSGAGLREHFPRALVAMKADPRRSSSTEGWKSLRAGEGGGA